MWGLGAEELAGKPCCVCGESLPRLHHTLCEACAGAFHLRMTETEQARDCGQIYLDEQRCTTVFLCNPCYTAHFMGSAPGGEAP